MADVMYLTPNDTTDPAFGKALREAAEAGVRVMAVDCAVTEDSMVVRNPVEVRL
jgi:sugar fermentation stimulation protein A